MKKEKYNIVENKNMKLANCPNENKPQRAVILAAGIGLRMVPINTKLPKGLLKVKDEPLIERLIKQLQEVGIKEIHIVVGYLKEKYDYLIDKYNVNLIVNRDYSTTGNISSLKLASKYIENAYILPCNVWSKINPFNLEEKKSWYLVNNLICQSTEVKLNEKNELNKINYGTYGNKMLGIGYIDKKDASIIREKLEKIKLNPDYDDTNWEKILYENDRVIINGRVLDKNDVISINKYEELRELDENSDDLKSYAISIIKDVFKANDEEIKNIIALKKGMTNKSFMFECKGSKYIMRIPGKGTEKLINRKEEAYVYSLINNKNICDDIIYINPSNGYKITKYIEGARVCDVYNFEEVKLCMEKMKKFHELKLKVNHEFDIFDKANYYEGLWGENISKYDDYEKTKKNIFSLKKYLDDNAGEKYLSHIDPVPDNFIISEDKYGKQYVRLIDWEYAAMQDPHSDIAMFAIYALYNKEEIDRLIDIYFENNCDKKTRIKIYCYIAVCGFLWSNWCEYKEQIGYEFGEYSLRQYRYAKDFYNYAIEEMKNK